MRVERNSSKLGVRGRGQAIANTAVAVMTPRPKKQNLGSKNVTRIEEQLTCTSSPTFTRLFPLNTTKNALLVL